MPTQVYNRPPPPLIQPIYPIDPVVNQIEKVCFTCGLLVGNSGALCSICGEEFKTNGTWKCKILAAGTRGGGRGRGRPIEEEISIFLEI